MCGICGELKFKEYSFSEEKLTTLIGSISNRGRDSNGIFRNDDIFLGHHRLSIIDTSNKSDQPMKVGNYIIIFNGIIYNYIDLRKTLIKKGHVFNSSGDTEVILKMFIEYGNNCVNHLDGVFSFCIYDTTKKNIFLARDRFGIKPLYYSINEKHIVFSSSVKGIINYKNNKQINPIALNYQFTLHSVVPAPHTIISGINKLEPGCTMTISKSGKKYINRYFDIEKIEISDLSDIEIIEKSKFLLNKAIKKRLEVADVPVGILLSGGLDSSLITAISKKYKEKISTYSIGFNSVNEEIGNEFYYSDIVSKHFKTEHSKYNISNDELYEKLDSVIEDMSEPMFSQDSSAFYLLAQKVSQSKKVVLSGQGADEVFGGYFWYEKIMNEKNLTDIELISKFYLDRNFKSYKNAINENYVHDNFVVNDIKDRCQNMSSNLTTLDKVFRLEMSMFIIDDPVKRIDNMTMSHALEARVPFLDRDLVEFMLSVKASNKINKAPKYYLKKISEEYLNNDIVYRDKFYFPVPPLKILKDKFYNYCKEILTSENAQDRGLYNREYINKLIKEPNNNFTNINGNELWHFTLLERWLQLNIER
tara:strand:+ start:1334 stop:3100 length:1767 start_codon:yes stop_codon:yes gene_type:complete